MRRTSLRAYAMLILVMLLWAGNSIVGRAVRGDVPPFTLAFVRWCGAFLILAPFAWRRLRADAAELRVHWRAVLALGLLGVAAFNALLYSGLRHTSATNAMMIQAAIPALVLLFDRLFFALRPRVLQVVGVLMSTIGVGCVVAQGNVVALLNLHLGLGDALILGATLVWSLYTALLRLKPRVDPQSFVAATFLIGAMAMLPLAVNEWLQGSTVHWGPTALGAFVYVALLPSLVAYFLYNRAVEILGAGRAGQLITLMPMFGALLAALLLAEPLRSFHFWAMGFIVAGILFAAVAGRERTVRS